LTTKLQLTRQEEDDMVDYTISCIGPSLFYDTLHYLMFGGYFARKIVRGLDTLKGACLRQEATVNAVVKRCQETGLSPHDGVSNVVRAMIVNFNTMHKIAYQALVYLYQDKKKWLPIYEENPMNFILETTRLVTPAPTSNFITTEDRVINIGGKDRFVPKKTTLMVCLNIYNRDPTIFGADINEFNPRRKNLDCMTQWSGMEKSQELDDVDQRPVRSCMGRVVSIHVIWYIIENFKPKA